MIRRPPPPHRATTATLQAAYPFHTGGPPLSRGVYIGEDVAGGAFVYDPFLAYQAGLLRSPNMLVIGQLGYGKSSLVKTYVWRQLVFGRVGWIVDPKGEYRPLAEAAGGVCLRLHPGGHLRINPLDPSADGAQAPVRQLALVVALTEAALTRPLSPGEHAACQQALAAAGAAAGAAPTLPQVAAALLEPSKESARQLGTSVAGLAGESREAALALRRLVVGDLAGMFDAPTSTGINLDAPVVVVDVSALETSAALAMVLTCAFGWLESRLRVRDGIQRLLVNDEAWRLISHPGLARWLQSSWKLARAFGVQNIGMLHRLSDLDAAGDANSEQVRVVRGLLADVETRVVYRQEESEVPLTQRLLGLSDIETRIVRELPTGRAIWRVGRRRYLVDHRLGPDELALVNTDDAMTAVRMSTGMART